MSKNNRRFNKTAVKIRQIIKNEKEFDLIDNPDLKNAFDKMLKYYDRFTVIEKRTSMTKEFLLKQYKEKMLEVIENLEGVLPEEITLDKPEDVEELAKNGLINYLKEKGAFNKYFERFKNENNIPSVIECLLSNRSIKKRKVVIHAGPTNSGKTYNAKLALKRANKGIFLSPLKLLAKETYEDLNMDGVPCDLQTGDENIEVPFSNHVSMTIEKFDESEKYDVAVIDEAQLSNNSERGGSWTKAILAADVKELHICCSLNFVKVLKKLLAYLDEEVEVKKYDRTTELIVENKNVDLTDEVREKDAYIVFSKKDVLYYREKLKKLGKNPSILFGELPAEVRMNEVRKYFDEESDVIVATDSIGMGVNIPIKRIVFCENIKYDGMENRALTSQEVKQIAGRAGRRNMFNQGYVSYIKEEMSSDIKDKVKNKDNKITKLKVFPDDKLFEHKFIPINNRLVMWEYSDVNYRMFEKTVPERYYIMLDYIEEEIPRKHFFDALYLKKFLDIPFDYKKEELLEFWREMTVEYFDKKDNLDKHNNKLALEVDVITSNSNSVELDLLTLSFYYEKVSLLEKFSSLWGYKSTGLYKSLKDQLVEKINKLLD